MTSLSEGQYIKHFQYGCGVVTESDADRTTIDFDFHGIKKFVTGLMVVKAAEAPPKRSHRKQDKKAVATAAPAANPGAK